MDGEAWARSIYPLHGTSGTVCLTAFQLNNRDPLRIPIINTMRWEPRVWSCETGWGLAEQSINKLLTHRNSSVQTDPHWCYEDMGERERESSYPVYEMWSNSDELRSLLSRCISHWSPVFRIVIPVRLSIFMKIKDSRFSSRKLIVRQQFISAILTRVKSKQKIFR